MPLQNGNSFHPYFPWYGRIAGDGAQLAIVSVYHVDTPSEATTWNPLSANSADWVNQSAQVTEEIYRGTGRVQPNQDWRARKNEVAAEIETELAVRIDIAMMGNQLPGSVGIMPFIGVGDWVQVVNVVDLQGVPADDFILNMTYVVRNVSAASNSWEKTLLCDVTPNAADLDGH